MCDRSDLGVQDGKAVISTILKNKDAIKGARVAKEVTVLTEQETQVPEELEKPLSVWPNEETAGR